MKKSIIKKIFTAITVFSLLCTPLLCNENDLFDELTKDLNIDFDEDTAAEDTIFIDDIKININGTTNPEWVKSKLIISKGKKYKEKTLTRKIKYQKNYFTSTNLFYSNEVYLVPSGNGSGYVLYVDLVDGFMQIYNFSPWDVQWGTRHLLKGEELLILTAGLNTQAVEWNRPVVGGTPFSYYLYAEHFYGDYDNDSKINSGTFKSKLFASLGVFAEIGASGEYKLYDAGLAAAGKGQYFKYGGFINLFPAFQMFTPLGFSLSGETGLISEIQKNTAPYFDSSIKFLFHPVKMISLELAGFLNYTESSLSYICKPSPFSFRSSQLLERKSIFTRYFLQLNFERVFTKHLFFTNMTLNPYVFAETAAVMDNFSSFDFNQLHYSAGTAVAVGFEIPVNLLFSFGVKCAIHPQPGVKFLFSVDINLY